MKKFSAIILASVLILGLSGCSSSGSSDESTGSTTVSNETDATISESESETTVAEETEDSVADETVAGSETLVIYFSATGTTEGIATMIADITDADLYEITAAQPYTDDDRDWTNSESRCSIEQNDTSIRPEISSEYISLEGYSVIYIGYPIWFGQEPRIMDTFVENYVFDGITVIPFCTSGSSDIGQSGQNLADNAGSGNWLEGKRFAGDASEDEVREWIDSIAK